MVPLQQEAQAKNGDFHPVRRVVVPVGGMDREFLAQEQAVQFAAALGTPLIGLHVSGTPDQVHPDLYHYLERQCGKTGVRFEPLTLVGTDPVEVILAELDPLDMLVLGTERLGDRFHIGGITQRLMAHAPGPVQVVRLGRFDQEVSPREARRAYARGM